jgi:hypothetical protein
MAESREHLAFSSSSRKLMGARMASTSGDARVWGNAPKDLVRAPGLFQVDTAIQRTVGITDVTT